MASTAADLGAGAIFGSALLTSGVYAPSIIVSQLRLDNFHMLESFLAASAVSAILVTVADMQGVAKTSVRPGRSLGVLPYDANLLGGLLQGAGMALTGACPGTVLVQIATGVPTGYAVGLGGLAGGVLFALLAPSLAAPQRRSPAAPPETVQGALKVSGATVLALYEAMCLGMIAASTALFPTAPYRPDPVVGGLLIGAAQAATILLTRRTVGVSGGYGDVGAALVHTAQGRPASFVTPSSTFAAGILAGSFALAHSGYIALPRMAAASSSASPAMAALGGLLGIFGARLAGGCTSGHGISGMATFSLSSLVTVAAMFGGGIAAAHLL